MAMATTYPTSEKVYTFDVDDYTTEITVYTDADYDAYLTPNALLLADGTVGWFVWARQDGTSNWDLLRCTSPSETEFLTTENSCTLTHKLVVGTGGNGFCSTVFRGDEDAIYMLLLSNRNSFAPTAYIATAPTTSGLYIYRSDDEGITWDLVGEGPNIDTGTPVVSVARSGFSIPCYDVFRDIWITWGDVPIANSFRKMPLVTSGVTVTNPCELLEDTLAHPADGDYTANTPPYITQANSFRATRNLAIWRNRMIYPWTRESTGTGTAVAVRWRISNVDDWEYAVPMGATGESDNWEDYHTATFNDDLPETGNVTAMFKGPSRLWGIGISEAGDSGGSTDNVLRIMSTDLTYPYGWDDFVVHAEVSITQGNTPIGCELGERMAFCYSNRVLGFSAEFGCPAPPPLFVPHKKWRYEPERSEKWYEWHRQNWLRVQQWADQSRQECLFRAPYLNEPEMDERNWLALERWARSCTCWEIPLHVPHKRNPSPSQEERNWVFVEQWTRRNA